MISGIYFITSSPSNVVVGNVLALLTEEDTKFFELLRLMAGYFNRVAPR